MVDKSTVMKTKVILCTFMYNVRLIPIYTHNTREYHPCYDYKGRRGGGAFNTICPRLTVASGPTVTV